jgi:hypothetical protein
MTGLPILVIFLFLTISFFSFTPAAGAASSVSIIQPSGLVQKGEIKDYWTMSWGKASDMTQEDDIHLMVNKTCPPYILNYSEVNFGNGIFSAKYAAADGDPWLWLLDPGYRNALHVGKDGNVKPIDATQYTQLTFRMYLGGSFNPADSPGGKLIWTRKDSLSIPLEPNDYGMSKLFRVYPGWNIYTIDLTSIGLTNGNLNWSGLITGLRLYTGLAKNAPINEIKLDWVRLTPKPTNQVISWTGSWIEGAVAEVSVSGDGVSFDPVRSYSSSNNSVIVETDVLSAGLQGSGGYSLPASFPPGEQYLRVKIQDGQGSITSQTGGPWRFTSRPLLQILSPSFTSGRDFAAALGNPWDMNDSADIPSWLNLTAPPSGASPGLLTGTSSPAPSGCNGPWGNPQLFLNTGGQTIDSDFYRYLSVRIKINTAFDFGYGWVSRLIWIKSDYNNFGYSNDLPLYSGWNVFHIDLWGKVNDEVYPGLGDYLWKGGLRQPTQLRFDPHEIPPSTSFEVDYIKLTGNDYAPRDGSFLIRYLLDKTEGVSLTFFYDNDRNALNGRNEARQFVVPFLPPAEASHSVYLPLVFQNYTKESSAGVHFLWDLTGVPAGAYYIGIDVTDEFSTTTWYSETPVLVQ